MLNQITFICFFFLSVAFSFKLIDDLDASASEITEDYKKGGGKEFQESHHSSQGERGDRGYEAQHRQDSGHKGHHDKEGHKKQYAEEGGNKKSHNHDDGYYDEQHKSAEGHRGYHYADHGSYAKGHNTKGHHNIHKLNEFKKKTEFFDEDHDKAFKENHGGYEENKEYATGGSQKGGHGKKVYLEGKFGKSGEFEAGKAFVDEAGHKRARGKDGFYENGAKFAKKAKEEGFKKFGYSERRR